MWFSSKDYREGVDDTSNALYTVKGVSEYIFSRGNPVSFAKSAMRLLEEN